MLIHRELTGQVIGLAIEVHQTIEPGLLESVYCESLADEECLADEPRKAG